MEITVVLEQMFIILILILTGLFLFRKKMLSEETSRQISDLIVNVTNPAVIICAAFDDTPKVPLQELGLCLLVFLLSYFVLFISDYLITLFLKIPDHDRYSYHVLSIFGNVGFIGIPIASAVLGTEALVFVSLNILIFNILIYSYGMILLKKAAIRQGKYQPAKHSESQMKNLINAGTVSAVFMIVFYLADLPIPSAIYTTLNYAGRSTTFLSMLVLGVSLAQMAIRDIFSQPKLYIFIVIRQILLPVAFGLALRHFINNSLILDTAILLLAVPAANMPLMISKQLQIDTDTISQGIILGTLLSLITIPIVVLVL